MSISFVYALGFLNTGTVLGSRVLLTLFAIESGASPATIGLLATTFAIFPMLLSWFSGRLSDRYGQRWPLLFGTAGLGAGMLIPYFAAGLPAIFAAAALSGFSVTFYAASIQHLVGQLSKAETRARNFSNYSLMMAVAGAAGPWLVGVAIDHGGHRNTLLYLVAVALVAVVMLLARGSRLPGGEPTGDATTAGLKETLIDPRIWPVLAASSVAQIGTDIFKFYMPVYGYEINLSASAIGMLLAMPAIAGFIARVMLPSLTARLGEERVLAYAFALGMVGFALMPLFKMTLLLALLSLVFGLGMYCCQPITMIMMYERSPAGSSGAALGLRLTADNITKVVGPAMFGLVAAATGVAGVFWLNALLLGAGGALSGVHARRGTLRA